MTCWSIVKCRYNAAKFIAILQCTSVVVSATNTFVQFHICVIKSEILCMVNISWTTYNDIRTVIYINIVSNGPRWTNLEDIWNGLKFYKKSISQTIVWSNTVILFGFQCPNQSIKFATYKQVSKIRWSYGSITEVRWTQNENIIQKIPAMSSNRSNI